MFVIFVRISMEIIICALSRRLLAARKAKRAKQQKWTAS